MKQKNKKIAIVSLLGVLLVVVAVTAFYLVSTQMKEKNYTVAIQSAEKYLEANNYEGAIIQYKEAISLNPLETEAYLALADIYVEQEQPSKARAILQSGWSQTVSPLIRRRMEDLAMEKMVFVADTGKQEKTVDEAEAVLNLETASADISWNTSFMQKIQSYQFADYKTEFGSVVSSQMGDSGYLEVVHAGLDGTFYYRNTEANSEIVDVTRNTPYETSMPEKIRLNTLTILFRNFEGGISLDRLQVFFGERVQPSGGMIQTQKNNCVIKIETDENGNIVSNAAWNEIELLNANTENGEATISGTVVNAVDGNGVEGAVLTFKSRTTTELEAVTAETDSMGAFVAELAPDTYSIVIQADGFIEEKFEFVVEEDESYSGVQFIISPELLSGTARIVLEWNAEPQDLDSYLEGSTDAGASVFTMFRQRTATFRGDTVAELDVDAMDGYGPETTTIYDLAGDYTFWVADYRRTGTMSEYGATVKVYLPGQDVVTIDLDSGAGVEDIWMVCEINHGELNILNDAPLSEEFRSGSK